MTANTAQVSPGKQATPDGGKIRGSLNLCLLLALVFLGLAAPVAIAAAANQPANSDDIRIELKDGLLTADIHDTPLPQVLEEIGKLAGFKVVQVGDFNDFRRVNSNFSDLPVQTAVERLVANANRIFFYRQDATVKSGRVLSQLWLLGPGEAGADTTQRSEEVSGLQHEEPLIRSQAVLRLVQQEGAEAVLEKLTVLLQSDPDPLVRSRVASALGSLGNERAVSELESALQDPHVTVRTQSMTALGQIGGDRAVMALGSVLTDEGIDPVERVIAAQTLWKQDSEIAQSYLQASSNDRNEQVRAASMAPPSVPVAPADGAQVGNEVAQ